MALKKGEQIFPGLEDEVALEQAKGTISSLYDAIVELVTNSDDSYSSMEQEEKNVSGKIEIYVKRIKGRKLLELAVYDEALGMTPEKLENVIRYGKKTSDLFIGKNVRGFFGRGLKESIIALGNGEIITVSESKKTHGKYCYDFNRGKLAWITLDDGSKTNESSSTKIIISTRETENIICPEFDTLYKKIRDHFALRDILCNPNRKVFLTVEKLGYKEKKIDGPKRLKFESPSGQQIENKKFYLKGFGVTDFKFYEAPERLYFSRNDPCSLAGILIKTSNATLENQLFGYDNNPDAHYFFGEIRCPGIFEKIKEKERGLIRSDRKGLYWNHHLCIELEKEIKTVLFHHVDRKTKQSQSLQKKKDMPEARAKKFRKLFKKLNSLGRQLLSDIGPGSFIEPGDLEISHLTIFPAEAIAPPGQDRAFSIYTPVKSFRNSQAVQISLDDSKGKFELSERVVNLKKHDIKTDLAIGYFKIKGFRTHDRTGLIAKQGPEEDYAEFAVGITQKRERLKSKEPPKKRKGGLFRDIEFDIFDKNPPQRVYYDRNTGIVRIYIYYPGISPYLGEKGEGSESERGSILLSELLAEAFCRETARRKVGSDFFDPEAQLDQYLKVYNEHLKLCIPVIQGIFIS